MSSGTRVSNVKFTHAPRADFERGLLGWLAFDVGGTWHVDGVVLRRTREGQPALAFPARMDRAGREHPYLRPTCDRARREIERAVLAELGLEAGTVALPVPGEESCELARATSRRPCGDAAVDQCPEHAPAELDLRERRHGRQRSRRTP